MQHLYEPACEDGWRCALELWEALRSPLAESQDYPPADKFSVAKPLVTPQSQPGKQRKALSFDHKVIRNCCSSKGSEVLEQLRALSRGDRYDFKDKTVDFHVTRRWPETLEVSRAPFTEADQSSSEGLACSKLLAGPAAQEAPSVKRQGPTPKAQNGPRDSEMALASLAAMRAAGVPRQNRHYNFAIGALTANSSSQHRRATALLGEMRADGLEPDARTHGLLVRSLARCSEWARVLDYLRLVRFAGERKAYRRVFPEFVQLSGPYLHLYKCAMTGFLESSQWEHASRLWSSVRFQRRSILVFHSPVRTASGTGMGARRRCHRPATTARRREYVAYTVSKRSAWKCRRSRRHQLGVTHTATDEVALADCFSLEWRAD